MIQSIISCVEEYSHCHGTGILLLLQFSSDLVQSSSEFWSVCANFSKLHLREDRDNGLGPSSSQSMERCAQLDQLPQGTFGVRMLGTYKFHSLLCCGRCAPTCSVCSSCLSFSNYVIDLDSLPLIVIRQSGSRSI